VARVVKRRVERCMIVISLWKGYLLGILCVVGDSLRKSGDSGESLGTKFYVAGSTKAKSSEVARQRERYT